MNKLIYTFILLTILGCQSTEKVSEEPFEQLTPLIDQYAKETLRKGNLNNISVAIYRNGESYHNYYGALEKGGQKPANDQTLFEIASISKVFLGSLVAQAVLENKIALKDDIRKYLKSDYPNLEFEGTPITIQNLMTHTIGFDTPVNLRKTYRKIDEGHYQDKALDYNMDSLLEELKTVQLNKKPGTFYDYNNVGSELAAYILEQVNKRPYKAQLQRFLKELGMENTYLQEFEEHVENLAVGYDENNKVAPFDKNPLLGGSAGIITTLPDLAKFMKFQLESDHPIVKETTQTLYADQYGNVMGYLWQDMGVAEEEGFYYSKTGDANGIKSGMLICPDSHYGQIVIVNNQTEAATDNWGTLFNQIETDLIKYPKINLYSLLKPAFMEDKKQALAKYKQLINQDNNFFNSDLSWILNRVGYDLLFEDKKEQAIELFKFAIHQDPDNANLFDSLGDAYFRVKDYEKALFNYKKSVELNPENNTAKENIDNIKMLLKS